MAIIREVSDLDHVITEEKILEGQSHLAYFILKRKLYPILR